jgi:ribosomal protein S18 acetylase RimI-like enzyme
MMEIRFLVPADAVEWKRLRIEALESAPGAFSASLEEYKNLGLDEVKRRLWADQDSFVVGAFDNASLAGMAGFFREKGEKSRHKGRIWGVYVSPEFRGRGIGRTMMEAIIKRAAAIEGLAQVLLSVAVTQSAALGLYRSLGFESWGREPRALNVQGQWIDEEYMVLRLNSWE